MAPPTDTATQMSIQLPSENGTDAFVPHHETTVHSDRQPAEAMNRCPRPRPSQTDHHGSNSDIAHNGSVPVRPDEIGDRVPPVIPQPFEVEVIRSTKRVKTASARLVKGVIQVRIPSWMTSDEQDGIVADLVARVEKRHRCSHIPLDARARELAARFDLPEPRSIRWVQNQNLRWGSCTVRRGDIRISSKLTEVPPWVLDHVIIHELAHLVEDNHSPAFHALVNRNPRSERAEGYLQAVSDLHQRSDPANTAHRTYRTPQEKSPTLLQTRYIRADTGSGAS